MRVLFAGTPAVAVPSLDALIEAGFEIVAVLTRPDAPTGRKRVLTPSPVARRAAELGIDIIHAAKVDAGTTARISAAAPDVAAIVAYGGLVPPAALAVPRHGWVNLHFSLLPAWRGAAPVQRAIMAGDEVTGATTFLLEEGLDTGPTYGVMTETIRPTDTAGELLHRLAEAGAGLLLATLDGIENGDLEAVPQSPAGVSSAPKISVEDARIRWGTPALAVDRQVRGCTPAPGAWTTFRGERLKVHPVAVATVAPVVAPGELVVTKREVLVGTATGPVRLGTVQPHGKKPMGAADWARGVRIETGEKLGA